MTNNCSKPEIQRYWQRIPRMDAEGERLDQWFFGMLDRMNRDDPIGFAGLQFHAAMELEREREEPTHVD